MLSEAISTTTIGKTSGSLSWTTAGNWTFTTGNDYVKRLCIFWRICHKEIKYKAGQIFELVRNETAPHQSGENSNTMEATGNESLTGHAEMESGSSQSNESKKDFCKEEDDVVHTINLNIILCDYLSLDNEANITKVSLNVILYDKDQGVLNSLKKRLINWSNKHKEKAQTDFNSLIKDNSKGSNYTVHLCKTYKEFLTKFDIFKEKPTAANFHALEENIDLLNGVRCNCTSDQCFNNDFEYE